MSPRRVILTVAVVLLVAAFVAWVSGHYAPAVGLGLLAGLVGVLAAMYGRDKAVPLGTQRRSLAEDLAARETEAGHTDPGPVGTLPRTPEMAAWIRGLYAGLHARGLTVHVEDVEPIAEVLAEIGPAPLELGVPA